jgi:predicted DNA-binding mobile mystery protein A
MNRRYSQALRLYQLTEQLQPTQLVHTINRPVDGWLRAVRQALGLSLKTVGGRLKVTPQAIHELEKSESVGSISLRQLEAVAGAMGCRVVYTLLPIKGTLAELASADADRTLRSVQHSMSLEDQAVKSTELPGQVKP